MKSTNKVTVQIEDYKGELIELTGYKSLRRNSHGNIRGYVGREVVKQFGEDNLSAAKWLLDTDDLEAIAEFCTKHILV